MNTEILTYDRPIILQERNALGRGKWLAAPGQASARSLTGLIYVPRIEMKRSDRLFHVFHHLGVHSFNCCLSVVAVFF